jgi:ABC-type lipoprotein release transport system permease subunit
MTGVVLSLAVLFIQGRFGIIQLPVGDMPNLVLPVNIRLLDYVVIPLVALLITGFSIWLPARNAGKVNPINLIREVV